jgi:pyridinium-3,5-biscarboxylic acid mononucleotide synthase
VSDIHTMTSIQRIVEQLAAGTISPEEALHSLRDLPSEDIGFAQIDHHRPLRNGMPEVIFGQGKTPSQIVAIAERLMHRGHPVLITRLDEEAFEQCAGALSEKSGNAEGYDSISRTWLWNDGPLEVTGEGLVVVACAGTSDLPVAEEAARTAEAFGNRVERVHDVGVAGLHRLLSRVDLLNKARVIIAVAGMDGALPSVLAGLVACPVIAVPCSVGYGANFGGVAPLLTMLNSCSAGVTVVNIDNGFGAAAAASLINHPAPLGVPSEIASQPPTPSSSRSDQLISQEREEGSSHG